MVPNEPKIARAVEECLTLMNASDAPRIAEREYISKLQSDQRWTDDEVRALQHWVKQALDRRES